ncbi:MAG: transporter substrate-binding domain-containing protein [Desulfobacterales bacterium]|nr:transporter substrate-binding domain-containing protein [Desulfobacterales bacterium]
MKKNFIKVYTVISVLLFFLLFSNVFSEDTLLIKVGIYENHPKVYTDENGAVAGLFPDILKSIASIEGWAIQYVPANWTECLNNIELGNIDVMVDVAISEARMERFDFNEETILISFSTIYTNDSNKIESYLDLKDKRIAVMAGSINYVGKEGIKKVLESFNINAEFIEYKSYKEVFEAVQFEKADAGVVNSIFGTLFENNYKLFRSPIVFNPSQLRFAFTKNSEIGKYLIPKIDSVLKEAKKDRNSFYYKALNKYIYGKIDSKNQNITVKPQQLLDLTDEEKDWISRHKNIRIGIDPEFVPFEYIDNNGVYRGISFDYVTLLNERLGLDMHVVEGLSWKEVIERAKAQEIDVLPCVGTTEERKNYLLFSKPYVSYHRVILTKSDAPFIIGLNDLYDKKVGVQAGSSHDGFLKDRTSIQPIRYKTLHEGLMALSGDRIDAFVGNIASASYWIRKLNLTNLKIAAPASFEVFTLHFAVRKDWPALINIINKGLDSITLEEEQAIQRRWIKLEYKAGFDPRIVWNYIIRASIVIFLIFFITLFWSYRLKKENTLRKQMEESLAQYSKELEQANKQLKDMDRLKNMFIASVSHELRTPLNSIIGFTGIILKGMTGELNPKQKDQLGRVYNSANHLLSLITDVIDISKIEAGKIDIFPQKFKIAEVIKDTILSIQPQIQAKSLALKFEVPDDIEIYSDKKRFQQCILNYLSNAVKYSEHGFIRVNAIDLGDTVKINVEDTGIGIAPNDMACLFEPFERLDSHLRIKAGGTGLGLYLTRKIATELLKGELKVSSKPGKGSIFSIIIPKDIKFRIYSQGEEQL